jgi:hypothetical protein
LHAYVRGDIEKALRIERHSPGVRLGVLALGFETTEVSSFGQRAIRLDLERPDPSRRRVIDDENRLIGGGTYATWPVQASMDDPLLTRGVGQPYLMGRRHAEIDVIARSDYQMMRLHTLSYH